MASLPDVDARLMRPVAAPKCLTDGQKDYSVPQLERAYDCQRTAAARARGRLSALQSAVRDREAVAKKAAEATP